MLWRYAKKSVALRIRYLITSPKGADSNTVLVQDIPGIGFGTHAERAKSVAPKFVANKVPLSYPARLPPIGMHAARASAHRQRRFRHALPHRSRWASRSQQLQRSRRLTPRARRQPP